VTTIPNGAGNEGPKLNDIGGPTRTPRAPRARGPADGQGAADPSASVLHLSARGAVFVSLRARLDGLEASRPERVEQLRQLVASGRYQPDGAAVARPMLDDPATAAALGIA
jgi:flagellar biosynthesis anti-sigma factor FlgM